VHIVFSFLASTMYRFIDKAVAILVGTSKNMEGRLVTMVFEITGVRKRVAELFHDREIQITANYLRWIPWQYHDNAQPGIC
jgi:hypothetical protein